MEIASMVLEVGKYIVEICKSVEGCKEQCKAIAARCSRTEAPIKLLMKHPERVSAKSGTLSDLLELFNEIKDTCSKYTDVKYIRKALLAVRGKNPSFTELNIRLSELLLDLGLEVGAIHSINAAEKEKDDRAFQLAVMQFIQANNVRLDASMDTEQKKIIISRAAEASLQLSAAAESAACLSSDSTESAHHSPVGRTTTGTPTATESPRPKLEWSILLNSIDLRSVAWSPETSRNIGQGGFGVVYEVSHRGQKYALKHITYIGKPTARELKKAKREALTLHMSKHFNVISFLGADIEAGLILMELAVGSLHDILYKDLRLPGSDAANATLQAFEPQIDVCIDICSALQFMHYHGIIHRDINARNILFATMNETHWVAKISDFGLATSTTFSVTSTSRSADRAVGTDAYMSPELIEYEHRPHYSAASDMYAFGITLNEMGSRSVPFEGLRSIQIGMKIVKGEPPPIMPYSGEVQRDYVLQCIGSSKTANSCLHLQPTLRIDAPSLLENLTDIRRRQRASTSSKAEGSFFSWKLRASSASSGSATASGIGTVDVSSVDVGKVAQLFNDMSVEDTSSAKRPAAAAAAAAVSTTAVTGTTVVEAEVEDTSQRSGIFSFVSTASSLAIDFLVGNIEPLPENIGILIKRLDDCSIDKKESIVESLRNLISDDTNYVANQNAVMDAGGMDALIRAACGGTPPLKNNVRYMLKKLGISGWVPQLIVSLRHANDEGKELVTGILCNISGSPDVDKAIVDCGGIFTLLMMVRDGKGSVQSNATGALRALVAQYKSYFFKADAVPIFHVLAKSTNSYVRWKAEEILQELFSKS